jgi:NADPH:quinone reductase-like Zn-dependent oxidoreductase
MSAVRLDNWGIENIRVENAADPDVGSGAILITTEASTIHPADVGVVTGQ